MELQQTKVVHLENGIRVILDPILTTRTVSIGIHAGAGSSTEEAGTMGYSHFLEHLVFKGTGKRNYIAVNRDIEKYGGYLNAYTDRHNTLFYVKILGDYLLQALDVLTDIVFNPVFPKEEIEKEKKVVLEEIAMYEDNPDESIVDLFFEHVYPDSFLGWPILGREEIIKKITREKILEYWEKFYTNENIIVSVAGRFNEGEVLDFLKQFPAKPMTTMVSNIGPSFHYGTGYREKEVEQAHLALGTEAFSLFDERKYPLIVFNNMFGSSSSSRLYLNIREKRGLSYSISSFVNMDEKSGVMGIFTSTQGENLQKITDAIVEEIGNVRKNPFTEEELLIAKAQIRSRVIFNQENINHCMQKNISNLFWHGKLIPSREILEKVEEVKLEDVYEVFETVFSEKGRLSAYAILPYGYGKKIPEDINITTRG
jgi:predicted Zn-dependent peptidase